MKTSRTTNGRWLAGMSLAGLVGYATPSLAANECGLPVSGSVTCTSAGNPYAGGITYAVPGDLAITSSGQVSTAAANTNGIVATVTGNLAVTATTVSTSGADSAGIIARSTGGTISINAGTVTVGANGGAAILALGQGDVAITSGTASALNNSAVFARSQSGAVSLTLTGANTATTADSAVSLASGSTISVTVAAGASVVGQSALSLAPQTSATVSNAGTLTGTAGYAVLAKSGTTTVLNSGTLNAGVVFSGGGNSLVNSGTFNVTRFSIFGSGGVLTNSGLVQVTAAAPAGGISFFGLGTFANSGTVSLANNRAGDVLTLPGTFAGAGPSTLVLDTVPGGAVDQLVIGGAATGVTTVQLVNVGGGLGLLNSGTVIVRAGAGTSATAFQLAPASASAGFVQYAIAYSPAAQTFSLVATPSAAAYRPLRYAEGARNIWYKTSEVWEAHMRSLRDGPGGGARLWGQFYGSADSRRDAVTTTVFGQTAAQDLSYRQDTFGAQLGLDLLHPHDAGGVALGVTAGYVNSDLQFTGQSAGARFNVANLGAYAGFHAGAFFVDLFGQYAHHWIKASDPSVGFSQSLHGDTYGAAGEIGIRFGDTRFFVEPLVTIAYVRTHLDTATALASSFDFHDSDGWRGKFGARLGSTRDFAGGTLTFYGGGNAVTTFQGRDTIVFTNNGTALLLRDNRLGTYAQGYAGLTIAKPGGISGFFEGFGDYGARDSQRGGGARVGLRVGF